MFRSLLICGVALAAVFTSAAHSQQSQPARGRLIGDGTNTPREIVANKPWNIRAKEIVQWMGEKGAETSRNCNRYNGCAYITRMQLTNGYSLSIKTWDDGATIYCRGNPQSDKLFCYSMKNDSYFEQVFETSSKRWVQTWGESDDKNKSTAQPSPKRADIEL